MEENENLFQKIKLLEERFNKLEEQINGVDHHFSRIEEKVNYIINLLETLWSDVDDDELEDELDEEDNGNEGWLPELDAWKEED